MPCLMRAMMIDCRRRRRRATALRAYAADIDVTMPRRFRLLPRRFSITIYAAAHDAPPFRRYCYILRRHAR